MSIKLYVDHLQSDKSIGFTSNEEIIHYNLIKLNRTPNNSPAFSTGRYICTLHAHPLTMFFIDFKKQPNEAQKLLASKDIQPDIKQKLQSLIETYNSTYESTKDFTELVVGFPSSIVE